MPCRRHFRVVAAGDRVHRCGRVLPYRARRRHRVLGNVREVAQYRAIRNADRRQPRARRARANPFARVHIEPPDRSRRAFRRHHRAGRDQCAHMAVPIHARGLFREAGTTRGGESPRKQRARRMAPRPYDPSHRRHRDLRLGAAVLRAVQHALHLYGHWLALDQPIYRHHAAHSYGCRRFRRRRAVRSAQGALPGHRHVLDDAALSRRDARGGGRRAVRCRRGRLLPGLGRVHDVLYRGVRLDCTVPARPRPVVQHGASAQQRDRHRDRRTRAAGDQPDKPHSRCRAAGPPDHRHQRAALRRRHAGFAAAPEGWRDVCSAGSRQTSGGSCTAPGNRGRAFR